jgi:AraC-like DNA-binding protein
METMAGWSYWRSSMTCQGEVGLLAGTDPGLRSHFHDEDQLTFVLSGRRQLVIGGRIVDLMPGDGVIVPAGVPHRSLHGSTRVSCLNAYLPRDANAATVLGEVGRHWRRPGGLSLHTFADIVAAHAGSAALSARLVALGTVQSSPRGRVGRTAARAGMSRECFTRRFTRDHDGMPPQAFWLAIRLNRARSLLRIGTPIATAAAEAGFADQSHLGRLFRRAFGTTPGRYRAAWLGEATVTSVPDPASSRI